MARIEMTGWRLAVACIALFALVLGAVVAVRVLTAHGTGSGVPVPGTGTADNPLVVSPHLITSVPDSSPVVSMAFSPDGKTLAVRLDSGLVQLRDAVTGSVLGVLNPGREGEFPQSGATLAFSPDGKTLAVTVNALSGFGSSVDLFDMAARKLTATLPLNTPGVFSVAYSPDGKTLAVGAGMFLVLVNLATRTSVSVPTHQMAYAGDARYISYSANGKSLAVANDVGLVRLWDVPAGRFVKSTTVYPTQGTPWPVVDGVSVSPDGRTIAVAGSLQGDSGGEGNGQHYGLRATWLWNIATGKIDTLTKEQYNAGAEDEVYSAAYSPDGRLLATGDSSGQIDLWNTATDETLGTFASRSPSVGSLAFSPSGKILATAGGTNTSIIGFWNIYEPSR